MSGLISEVSKSILAKPICPHGPGSPERSCCQLCKQSYDTKRSKTMFCDSHPVPNDPVWPIRPSLLQSSFSGTNNQIFIKVNGKFIALGNSTVTCNTGMFAYR